MARFFIPKYGPQKITCLFCHCVLDSIFLWLLHTSPGNVHVRQVITITWHTLFQMRYQYFLGDLRHRGRGGRVHHVAPQDKRTHVIEGEGLCGRGRIKHQRGSRYRHQGRPQIPLHGSCVCFHNERSELVWNIFLPILCFA